MKRIAIVGGSGAGKSWLARELGAITGLPVIHLDAVHWRPGWVETPDAEWRTVQSELVSRDAWIIDGNYGGTMEIRLAAADTIVFMDFGRLRRLAGVLRRYLRHRDGSARPDMGPECPERLNWGFLRWVWAYPNRPEVVRLIREHRDGRCLVVLRNPRDRDRFLAEVRVEMRAAAQ